MGSASTRGIAGRLTFGERARRPDWDQI